MILSWRIRYFDRDAKEFKNRDLYLDTGSLKPAMKAAVELAVETKSGFPEREFLKYRSLFHEDADGSIQQRMHHENGSSFSLSDYIEDECSKEISMAEIHQILTGNSEAILIPGGAEPHDIAFMVAEPKPIPVAEITLQPDEVNLLGYFCRDWVELSASALLKHGPGTIKSWSDIPTETGTGPFLETAVSDDEIRSYVTIFRRLYMKKEPANFLKAVEIYTKALGDHPFSNWVAGVANSYKTKLGNPPERHPFIPAGKCTFTRKRIIDVFIYTQYAHQPSPDRQRQYTECLNALDGKKSLLTWIFLTEIWKCGSDMVRAGKVIAGWFNHYCKYHNIVPDVLPSLRHENPGIGVKEKEEDRRARLFQEKVQELASELWNQHGQPPGGPSQYIAQARQQLIEAVGGDPDN